MNAHRVASRRNWPRGLRMPRPGYYGYDAKDGRFIPIGRVPLQDAIQQAIQANAWEAEKAPTLLDRLQGTTNTVADLLAKMPPAERPNTRASNASIDKRITAALGNVPLRALTPPASQKSGRGMRENEICPPADCRLLGMAARAAV